MGLAADLWKTKKLPFNEQHLLLGVWPEDVGMESMSIYCGQYSLHLWLADIFKVEREMLATGLHQIKAEHLRELENRSAEFLVETQSKKLNSAKKNVQDYCEDIEEYADIEKILHHIRAELADGYMVFYDCCY